MSITICLAFIDNKVREETYEVIAYVNDIDDTKVVLLGFTTIRELKEYDATHDCIPYLIMNDLFSLDYINELATMLNVRDDATRNLAIGIIQAQKIRGNKLSA